MGQIRTIEEQIADRMLLAYLVDLCKQEDCLLTITKLQKLCFLAKMHLQEKRMKGFNYLFFRWYWGPMSKEIYQDVSLFRSKGWLPGRHSFAFTTGAQNVLSDFIEDHNTKQNRIFFDWIRSIISDFGKWSPAKLKDYAYDLKVTPVGYGEPRKIKDIPQGWDILGKLEEREAKQTFQINEDWLESLELFFILTPETEHASEISSAITPAELFANV